MMVGVGKCLIIHDRLGGITEQLALSDHCLQSFSFPICRAFILAQPFIEAEE